MVRYPISVRRSSYRGHTRNGLQKAAEYNRDAAMLETHINDQIRNGQTGIFSYSTSAREVGLSVERVTEILFTVDCGHTGFTVVSNSNEPGSA